jgi:large subunit ribosomal protein L19
MALMDVVEKISIGETTREIPSFNVGDTVVVETKVVEGERERIQSFRGIVIGRRGQGAGEMFTVRRVSRGEGVERIFPLHSPIITKVEVLKRGLVKRAKLYYLRKLKGKKFKIREDKGAAAPSPAEKEKKNAGDEINAGEGRTSES